MTDDRRTFDSDEGRATVVLTPSGRLGKVYAERFRIERFLGAGAYGEVYEAYDLQLDQTVAVKLLRGEFSRDRGLLERFRREVRTARQVSHPNVCRVHDLFEHRDSAPDSVSGEMKATQLLSMELLSGETLAERVARLGALDLEVAAAIARQLADGLDAAHRAGVLHRDFKSGNVVLTEDSHGLRAVITDFGLARGGLGGADRGTLTEVGTMLGSPAYMAPEQVRGDTLSAASDVYSFGVVLYEMVSGELPFHGDSALQTALLRLHHAPPPPSELVPGLSAQWEGAILHCLQLDPADRPGSAAEAVAEIAGIRGRAGFLPPWRWRPRLARWAPWIAAGLLAAGLLSWRFIQRAGSPMESASHRRPSVAVLGLENLARQPDLDYIDHAFAEMLPMEIAGASGYRVVPSEQVRRARADLGLTSGPLSADSLERLRRLTGADRVVVGSYLANPGATGVRRLRFDIAVHDLVGGAVVERFKEEVDEGALLASVTTLGARLRSALGGVEMTPAEEREVAATRPRSVAGLQAYTEGLARLRVSDAPGALPLLEKAVAAEPENALVHSALASAWHTLGFDRRAREEASRAMDLTPGLPEVQRWAIEAKYRGLAGDHAAAIALHHRLTEAEPDDLDHLLDLARAQVAARKGADALLTVERLRTLPEPRRSDPRIDIVEGRAASSVADPARMLSAADRTVEQGKQLGAKLLTARGHLLRAVALRQLGRTPEAAADAEKARVLCEAAGDFAAASNAQFEIATVRMLGGDLDTARAAFERAADLGRRAESRSAVASALNGLAVTSRRSGHLVEAEQAFVDLRRTYQELGDRFGDAAASNGLGLVHVTAGRHQVASGLLENARREFREMGSRSAEAATAFNLADLRSRQGRLAEARQLATEVATMFRELGEEGGAAEAELLLARLDAWEDRIESARVGLEAATARSESAGELAPVAAGRMDQARLELEAGETEAALDLARRAVAAARGEDSLASQAQALLVQCLAAAGRATDAQTALTELRARGRSLAIAARLESARAESVLAATPDAARRFLQAALGEASRAQLPGQVFDLRLRLISTPRRGGPDVSAEFVSLAREARQAGFQALARRAEEGKSVERP